MLDKGTLAIPNPDSEKGTPSLCKGAFYIQLFTLEQWNFWLPTGDLFITTGNGFFH